MIEEQKLIFRHPDPDRLLMPSSTSGQACSDIDWTGQSDWYKRYFISLQVRLDYHCTMLPNHCPFTAPADYKLAGPPQRPHGLADLGQHHR